MYRMRVGDASLRLSDLLAVIVLFSTAILQPGPLLLRFSRWGGAAFIILVMYIFFQGLFLNIPEPAIKEASQITFIFLSLVAVSMYAQRYPELFLKIFVAGLFFSATTTIAYHLSIGQFTRYKLAGDGRYIFGNLSAILLLVASTKRWPKIWVWGFVLSLIPLALSLERRGQLGVVAILAILSLSMVSRKIGLRESLSSYALLIAGGAAIVAGYFAISTNSPFSSVEIYGSLSAAEETRAAYTSDLHRKSLLANGVNIVAENPYIGAGADQLRAAMNKYYTDVRLANGTHNFYLDTLIKYGFIGLGIFAVLIYSIIRGGRKRKAYSREGYMLIFYSLLTIGFMSDGGSVFTMLFSALLLPYLTRHPGLSLPVRPPTRMRAMPARPTMTR